ncbi:MAG: hypothetical protein U1F57_02715 [bacterium]
MAAAVANDGYGGYGYNGMNQNQLSWIRWSGRQQRDGINTARSQIRKYEQEMKVKMSADHVHDPHGRRARRHAKYLRSTENPELLTPTELSAESSMRAAKSKILDGDGRKRPPTAHDNTNDPAGAARDQNKQAKYTQWVSVTTQLMSEVQQTERELLDLLERRSTQTVNDLWLPAAVQRGRGENHENGHPGLPRLIRRRAQGVLGRFPKSGLTKRGSRFFLVVRIGFAPFPKPLATLWVEVIA